VVVAEHPPRDGEGLLVQFAGGLEVAEVPEGVGEVVHRVEGVGVVLPEDPAVAGQRLLVQLAGALEVAKTQWVSARSSSDSKVVG